MIVVVVLIASCQVSLKLFGRPLARATSLANHPYQRNGSFTGPG